MGLRLQVAGLGVPQGRQRHDLRCAQHERRPEVDCGKREGEERAREWMIGEDALGRTGTAGRGRFAVVAREQSRERRQPAEHWDSIREENARTCSVQNRWGPTRALEQARNSAGCGWGWATAHGRRGRERRVARPRPTMATFSPHPTKQDFEEPIGRLPTATSSKVIPLRFAPTTTHSALFFDMPARTGVPRGNVLRNFGA